MNNDRPVTREYQNDEIDLFELLQTLWQEKLLIAVVTFFCTCVAALYVFTVQPQYSVSMTLKPASLTLYGELVAGMKGKGQEDIVLGRKTAEEVLGAFARNLALQANQRSYFADGDIIRVGVSSKVLKSSAENELQSVTVQLHSFDSDAAADQLHSYLDFVGDSTLKELNSFVSGLGSSSIITQPMLYTVDAASSRAQLDKPKKPLIIALGLVIGGMLGVFFALVRSMLRKRKNTV